MPVEKSPSESAVPARSPAPSRRSEKPRIAVVVPVWNEAADLEGLLAAVRAALGDEGLELIVVDDGSDEPLDLVSRPHLRVLRHEVNRGYGAALKNGIRHSSAPLVAILDGDGSYDPRLLTALRARVEAGAEMAIAARSGRDGTTWLRRLPKWVLTRLAEYVSGEAIPDLNSGMRIFRRELALECWRLLPEGFSFTSTITISAISSGRRVEWVPLELCRRAGRSKIRPLRDTLGFFSLLLRISLYFDPLRIFMPMSSLFGLAALGSAVYDVIQGNLGDKTVLLFVAWVQLLALGLLADLLIRRLR